MTEPGPEPGPGPGGLRPSRAERRQVVVAATAFFGMLLVLVVVAAVASPSADPPATTTTITRPCATDDLDCLESRNAASPNIIPEPNEGMEPERAGDRGGWAQAATFAAIVVGLAVIVALAVRSARKARAD